MDLLDAVKSTHKSILSNDVLAHYGEGKDLTDSYANSVKFSISANPVDG